MSHSVDSRGQHPPIASKVSTAADPPEKMLNDALASFTAAGEQERRISEATRKLVAPLGNLMDLDPEASQALAELKDLIGGQKHTPGPVVNVTTRFDIRPGTQFFFPPYDFLRLDGRQGAAFGDATEGTFGVHLVPYVDFDGFMSATAWLGMGMETHTNGVLSVRPLLQTEWDCYADGAFLSAQVSGMRGFFITDQQTQYLVCPRFEELLFAAASDGKYPTHGADITTGELRFSAEAGRRYDLWLWTSVAGDQSGADHTFGVSFFNGFIDTKVEFVAVFEQT